MHFYLAFILADHGFDVWLGDQRGSVNSRLNIKYSPLDKRFWDFRYLFCKYKHFFF